MNFIVPLAVIVVLILISGFRVANEYERAVVFRLGRYTGFGGRDCFG